MKILRSEKPYWFYLMYEGIKTIEVGKVIPQSDDWNGWMLLYCSKDMKSFNRIPKEFQEKYRPYLGKVGAEVLCSKIYDITTPKDYFNEYHFFKHHGVGNEKLMENLDAKELLRETCLSMEELANYAKGKTVYGFDLKCIQRLSPTDLNEFFHRECKYERHCGTCSSCELFGLGYDDGCATDGYRRVTRPPQSWCYITVLEG